MASLKLKEFSKTHKIISLTILCLFAVTGIILIYTKQFDIVYLILRGHDYKLFGHLMPLILENFFGTATFIHPNWWKVLLGIVGFIIIAYLIIEKILLNYQSIHQQIDEGMLPAAWMIYYFAAAGCLFGLQALPEMGTIHSSIFFTGTVYLLAASLFGDINILTAIISFPLLLILCSIVYLFCFAMIWIAIIFIVIGIFKSLGSMGTAGGGNAHSYNKEADDLNWERNQVQNATESEARNLTQRIDEHNRRSGKDLLG